MAVWKNKWGDWSCGEIGGERGGRTRIIGVSCTTLDAALSMLMEMPLDATYQQELRRAFEEFIAHDDTPEKVQAFAHFLVSRYPQLAQTILSVYLPVYITQFSAKEDDSGDRIRYDEI